MSAAANRSISPSKIEPSSSTNASAGPAGRSFKHRGHSKAALAKVDPAILEAVATELMEKIAFDNEAGTVDNPDIPALVRSRNGDLALESQFALCELDGQGTRLVANRAS